MFGTPCYDLEHGPRISQALVPGRFKVGNNSGHGFRNMLRAVLTQAEEGFAETRCSRKLLWKLGAAVWLETLTPTSNITDAVAEALRKIFRGNVRGSWPDVNRTCAARRFAEVRGGPRKLAEARGGSRRLVEAPGAEANYFLRIISKIKTTAHMKTPERVRAYMYIYRERGRGREKNTHTHSHMRMWLFLEQRLSEVLILLYAHHFGVYSPFREVGHAGARASTYSS